jgi:hypothetical protein
MKRLTITLILLTSLPAHAGLAFFQYERITGMTKQCVYDYLGNEYTITLQAVQLCPLQIRV